jgi:hypothetical protein
VPSPERRRLFDLLGVRAVLLDARAPSRPPAVQAFVAGLEPAARCVVPTMHGRAPVEIFANPHALPRAFLVTDVESAAGAEDALRRLLDADFDPRRTALVEGALVLPRGEGGAPQPPGEAEITAYEAERVVVRTRSAAPSLLVLTDSFDPAWAATRNGEPAEILPADALFRGVALPAGEWEVEFRYRPRAFQLGVAFCAATLLVLASFAWRSRRRPIP